MTIKYAKGSFVRALEDSYGGGPAYIKEHTYEVKKDFHESADEFATVYTVEDSHGVKTNGWAQKFFEAVEPAKASTAGAASYAHSPGYQQGSLVTPDEMADIVKTWIPEAVPDKTKALQTQVGGAHYTDMTIQPIEYIQANRIPFPEGNIIKYVSRWRAKGGIKDLEKAKHHLELLIEFEVSQAS